MKIYKWTLRNSSKKEICPQCGQRRFVPYVLTTDGQTLAGAEYGRCDREQSCGYHRYPNGDKIEYIAEKVAQKPMLKYKGKLKGQTPTCEFFKYMQSILGELNAYKAAVEYQIGSIDNQIIWWQIDIDGNVRTGKIMKYLANGHRDKSTTFPVTWAHKHRYFKDQFEGEELKQCLFGEHLLARYPLKPVCVVESEKTAAMMSQFETDCVWVATGGSQGIKSVERLQVLQGRKVLLIPDNGQYYNWKRIADLYNWDIVESLEEHPQEGCDILDVVEQGLNQLKL